MNFRKFNKKHILEVIKENYLMPVDFKRDLINKNVDALLKIMSIVTFFGLSLFIAYIIKCDHDFLAYKNHLTYYGSMWFFGIQNIIYLIFAKKHMEWHPNKRNQGLYMGYVLTMGLCVFNLIVSDEPLRAFVLFAIITVLAVTLFTFEPLYFFIYTTLATIVFIVVFAKRNELPIGINILIYYIIIVYYSLSKWKTLIKNQIYSKNLQEHTNNLEKELQLAAYVQQSFYKSDFSGLENYEICIYTKAMSGVSGDLFDFYRNENKLDGLGIFDVSGHGIASGLITMLVRNIIHQEFYKNTDKPFEDVVKIIDERIKAEKGKVDNYLSGVLIRFNDDKLEIINAGHPNPILYKQTIDGIYYLDNEKKYSSTVLGMNSIESFYHSFTIEMERGDELFLYTDGITDAYNKKRESFGTLRLSEAVNGMVTKDFNEQLPYLIEQLEDFTQKTPFSDDITLIVLKRK